MVSWGVKLLHSIVWIVTAFRTHRGSTTLLMMLLPASKVNSKLARLIWMEEQTWNRFFWNKIARHSEQCSVIKLIPTDFKRVRNRCKKYLNFLNYQDWVWWKDILFSLMSLMKLIIEMILGILEMKVWNNIVTAGLKSCLLLYIKFRLRGLWGLNQIMWKITINYEGRWWASMHGFFFFVSNKINLYLWFYFLLLS